MNRIAKPSALDVVLLLATAAIWGSAFVAIKLSVFELGTFWTAATRVVIGFISLLPFFLILQPILPKSRRDWLKITVVALLNMVIPFILISWSMLYIDAGVGSLLLGTTPFFAMLLGHFLTDDERINTLRAVAVVVAFSGIAILVGPEAFSGLKSSALMAQVAIMLAGLCYVTAGFVMRRVDMPPIAFTTIALGAGSVMLIVVALFAVGFPDKLPSREASIALLWLGLFPTGLAYLLRFFLVKRVGLSLFALAMNSVPVFGIIAGAMILGEHIQLTTLAALALVLFGLVIARIATPTQN